MCVIWTAVHQSLWLLEGWWLQRTFSDFDQVTCHPDFIRFELHQIGKHNSLWSQTWEHHTQTLKQVRHQSHWFWQLVLYGQTCVYIHIVMILSSTWDHTWNSVHSCHWYMVVWSHTCWAILRLPIVSWWEWAWTNWILSWNLRWTWHRAAEVRLSKPHILPSWRKLQTLREFVRQSTTSEHKRTCMGFRLWWWTVPGLPWVMSHLGSEAMNHCWVDSSSWMDSQGSTTTHFTASHESS